MIPDDSDTPRGKGTARITMAMKEHTERHCLNAQDSMSSAEISPKTQKSQMVIWVLSKIML
jgi:hypothetical protein